MVQPRNLGNTTQTGTQSFPSVTGLADGRYVVSWTDHSATGGGFVATWQDYSHTGDDVMTGGGADVFVFSSGDNVVTDFNAP